MDKTITRRIKTFLLMLLALLSFVLVVISSPHLIFAYADEPVHGMLSAEDNAVHRGQAFDVDIELSGNAGLSGLYITIIFDHDVFTMTNVQQRKEGLSSQNMEHFGGGFNDVDDKTGGYNLMWDSLTKDYSNGRIVTLTFECSMTAPLGDHYITIKVDKENTLLAYKEPANVVAINPKVTVKEGKFIVVWTDHEGNPVENPKLTGNPRNQATGGYEFSAESTFNKLTQSPNALERQDDEKYSYKFKTWKAMPWTGIVPENTSVLWYVADYELTPQEYAVFYYVDGIDDFIPDGTASREELYTAKNVRYNEQIDLEDVPHKENYTFYGWYTDEKCTHRYTSALMPPENLNLYGYFKYNIRENDIPTIELAYRETKSEIYHNERCDIAYVDVFIRDNFGLNALLLTVDTYDTDAIQLCGFEWGTTFANAVRETTNTENGFPTENFIFHWETITGNSYETGLLVTMHFKVNTEHAKGSFDVKMTYDEAHDATYINSLGEIWYSKLNFIQTEIPIGERNIWNEPVPGKDEIFIEVDSEEGLPYNVRFIIEDVYHELDNIITVEEMDEKLGEDFALHDLYDLYYTVNGQRVERGGSRTIRIQLTERQQRSRRLAVYFVDSDGQMNLYNSSVISYDINGDGEEELCIEFVADHFSYWAIVGDYAGAGLQMDENVLWLIIMTIFFGIFASGYIVIILQRRRRGEPIVVYSADGTAQSVTEIPPQTTEKN